MVPIGKALLETEEGANQLRRLKYMNNGDFLPSIASM